MLKKNIYKFKSLKQNRNKENFNQFSPEEVKEEKKQDPNKNHDKDVYLFRNIYHGGILTVHYQ